MVFTSNIFLRFSPLLRQSTLNLLLLLLALSQIVFIVKEVINQNAKKSHSLYLFCMV